MPRPTHPYIATREGWLYLAVVISIQTRQVLGYSLSDRMPDDLVEQAFLNAWQRSCGHRGVLFQSVREPRLPAHAREPGFRAEHESQGKLLGQLGG